MTREDYKEVLDELLREKVIPELETRVDTSIRDAVMRYANKVDRQIDRRIRQLIGSGEIHVACDLPDDD